MTVPEDLLERYVDLWNRHDVEGVAALYHDQAERSSAIGGVRGKQAIHETVSRFLAAFPDSRIETRNRASSGEVLLYEVVDVGHHTGPLSTPSGLALGSGLPFRIEAAGVMVIRDSLIVAERVYFDITDLFRQLGLTGGATTSG